MLLLVLIIVLVAFGLLVVALLTGNVLVAWVSVGMSVIAAVVLLIDWLQRRSAVKAGEELDSTSVAMPATPQRLSDYEPATEVLPVIPAGPSAAAPEANGVGAYPAPAADARFDHVDDAQQTIVMPVIQPPGSAPRPSGAESDVTSSSGKSSLSVTDSGDARAAAEQAEQPPSAPLWTSPESAEATALVDMRKGPEASGAAVVESPTVLTPAAGSDGGVSESLPPVAHDALFGGDPEPLSADAAAVEPEGAALMALADAAAPDAAVVEDDAPEESRDPEVASLVATLEDEVIVIDEHPRYHVLGCRALDSRQIIPLPAREAVDLGFTPCGWCAPDRTLTSRHQTTGS